MGLLRGYCDEALVSMRSWNLFFARQEWQRGGDYYIDEWRLIEKEGEAAFILESYLSSCHITLKYPVSMRRTFSESLRSLAKSVMKAF